MPTTDPRLALLARRLGDLAEHVVFAGGSVLGLLIDDAAAAGVRPTDDVDVIVDVTNRRAYDALAARLRKRGFHPDTSEGAPLCRWRVDDLIVDVMPTNADVIGFTNRWYSDAITHARRINLDSGPPIRVVSAPHFIATKLEAFFGRGEGDYMASHDLEDIIAVVEGRDALLDEIRTSPLPLRTYLGDTFRTLLQNDAFVDALPGHLPGDEASQQRLPLLLERLRDIATQLPR